MHLTRRQALVGASAVVVAAALPGQSFVGSISGLTTEYSLDTAVGIELDLIGEMWGVYRTMIPIEMEGSAWLGWDMEIDASLRERLLEQIQFSER